MVFTAISDAEKFEDDIWICDSGASSHYCFSDRGMFDVKNINENICVGNGDFSNATKIGSLKCRVIQIEGSTFNIILHNVKRLAVGNSKRVVIPSNHISCQIGNVPPLLIHLLIRISQKYFLRTSCSVISVLGLTFKL
jgi:hypothetical protein